jgi:hypothetical protein
MHDKLRKIAFEIRCRWHWIAGGIAGFVSGLGLGPAIGGATGSGLFVAYEMKQDKDTGTKSYKDIFEFACAYFIGLASMMPLKTLRII